MKVQSFRSFSSINNGQYSSSPRQFMPNKVSFTATSDQFVKNGMDELNPLIEKLKQRFLSALEEAQEKKSYSNISEELGALAKKNVNLVDINETYKNYNSLINAILKNDVPELAKRMEKWIGKRCITQDVKTGEAGSLIG